MAGRTYRSKGYRYGFNGKENDSDGEWGRGLIQDYGFRLYNPAASRFLSVDPLRAKFPFYSVYQFAGNMPIIATDLDGAEPFMVQTLQALMNRIIVLRNPTERTIRILIPELPGFFTDLSQDGPGEPHGAFEQIGFLLTDNHDATMAFYQLGMGVRGNGNSMGVLVWRMIENNLGGFEEDFYKNAPESSLNAMSNGLLHYSSAVILASIYGKEEAKNAMDRHERDNDAFFTQEPQTEEEAASYEDRYRDLINNELGRNLGVSLRKKYGITQSTRWTNQLTANVLNDIQDEFGAANKTAFVKFQASDIYIARFTELINFIKGGTSLESISPTTGISTTPFTD